MSARYEMREYHQSGRPLAARLMKKMKSHIRGKVVDLQSVTLGRSNAEALQQTVATQQHLCERHPAHAVYAYAQNQVSVMAEQLTALKEMARFVKLISEAEEECLPRGPPMSPLTPSFY